VSAVDELTGLALAARDGDRLALAAFVRQTQPQVWRLCAHLAGRDVADDVAQDTYLRAIAALPAFRGDSSATTWLLSIARRAAADSIRRTVRRRRLVNRLGQRPGAATTAAPGAPIDVLLAPLDSGRREAFVLTQLLGLTYGEAAAVCGCPVGTIRSRVARAREQLVGEFGDESLAQ
jgi:RNA polymerase sigma-70 factor (ECF subfamily)